MSSSQRRNCVCRTCLSTDGELIPLFSDTLQAPSITEKIMNISHIRMNKEDGLPNKICRKCIYLIDSLHCFNEQMLSADRVLRMIKEEESEKRRKGNVFENVYAADRSQNTEHNELGYDIEWISDEVRVEVEKAFGRKWANERKKKVLEKPKTLQNMDNKELFLSDQMATTAIKTEKFGSCNEDDIVEFGVPEKSIKKETIANEKPEESCEDDIAKSKEPEKRMKTESTENANRDVSIKNESIDTEEFNATVHSEKSGDQKSPKDSKENEDPNIIIISDSSDEPNSANNRRKALTNLPTNSSGIIDNGNTSAKSQRGTKRRNRARVPVSSKHVLDHRNNKKSTTANTSRINPKISPRKFFQCTRCNIHLYTVAAVLLHHNQVHTANKDSLSCRMCDITFPAKSDLFAHFNQHVESHLFRCSYCPNEFVLKKNLEEHMNNHKKRPCLPELKSSELPDKRARIESVNSIEDCHEMRTYTNKKTHSAKSGEVCDSSGKENITDNLQISEIENLDKDESVIVRDEKSTGKDDSIIANLQIAVTQNLDKNAMNQEVESTGNTHPTIANLQIPFAHNLYNNSMDQKEEDTVKENSITTANSAMIIVESVDTSRMEQVEENCVNENRITTNSEISVVQNTDNSSISQQE